MKTMTLNHLMNTPKAATKSVFERWTTMSLATLFALSSSSILNAEEARALLMKDGSSESVYIVDANDKLIEYKKSARTIDKSRAAISSFSSIYFVEPQEFIDAMGFFDSRNYEEAQKAFAVAKDAYGKITELKGNYSTLAGFYEMESARKSMNLKKMNELRLKFIGTSLTRPVHKKQLDLNNTYWVAVLEKNWEQVLQLFEAEDISKLTVDQRAQVYYCAALGYEGKEEPDKALLKFNNALTSHFGGSSEIAQASIKGALRMIAKLPLAKTAMKLHGTPDERPNSKGAGILAGGAGLVKLWEDSIGGGKTLSADEKKFLKYLKEAPKAAPVAAPQKSKEAAAAKPAAKTPAKGKKPAAKKGKK